MHRYPWFNRQKTLSQGENILLFWWPSALKVTARDAVSMHRISEDTHKRCVSSQKKCTVFAVYKKCSSHHHLPAKAGLIFKKPHITHDAVFVTHAVTSESALSKRQIHQGQKGQVAPLSPQLPRPLVLTWEPAHSADHLVNEGSEQHKRHLARSSGVWALLLGWQAELVTLQSPLV